MNSIAAKWEKLSIQQRINLCRESAREAGQLAQAAPPELKAEYKRLAADWHQVAAELEQFGVAKSAVPIERGDAQQ